MERITSWGTGRGEAGGVELLAERGHGRARFNTARRAFAVLNLISLREGITAKTLSKELGVSLSTCYCLINILVEEGYVEKIAHRKGYRLGPAVSTLHSRARNRDIEGRVEPVVEDLALRSGRHAYFGLLSDGDVTVARVESPRNKPHSTWSGPPARPRTRSPWVRSLSPVRDLSASRVTPNATALRPSRRGRSWMSPA